MVVDAVYYQYIILVVAFFRTLEQCIKYFEYGILFVELYHLSCISNIKFVLLHNIQFQK